MNMQELKEKIKSAEIQKIGNTPVVVISLKKWQEIEDSLEDLAITQAQFLKKKIAKARKEKKYYSLDEIKKMVGM